MKNIITLLLVFLACNITAEAGNPQNDMELAEIYSGMAEEYENGYKFSKAIEMWEKALNIYKANNDRHAAATASWKLAKLTYMKVRYDKSLQYALSSLEYFQKNDDKRKTLDLQNLLSAIYFMCKDTATSEMYIQQSLKEAQDIGDTSAMLIALNNMAIYNSDTDSTISYYCLSEAIALATATDDTLHLCKIQQNGCSISMNNGNVSKARKYLEESLPYLCNEELHGDYYYNRARIEIMEGNADAAIHSLDTAVSYYSFGEFDISLQYCHLLMNELYRSAGNIPAAYRAISEYYKIDSILSRENMFVDLFRYKNDLMVEEEKRAEMQRRSRHLLLSSILVSSMLIILLVVYILLRRKNEILARQKLVNEKQEQEIISKNEIIELKKLRQYQIQCLTEEVSEKLYNLGKEIDDGELKKKIIQISHEICDARESGLKEIGVYMPEMNKEMFSKLLKDFPNLTVNERRLCCFLNMNMTTKEIADITRKNIQSINTARARLRTKLGLTGSDMSVQEFLSRYN